MAKKIAEAIVSQLADAYGELLEAKREIQAEMDALKDKIVQLGGDVQGDEYCVHITRAYTHSHYGMLAYLRSYHPLIVSRFETTRCYFRTTAMKLKKC
jgi:hypothetical protein